MPTNGEMTPGEISRTLQRIDATVAALANELRDDMRDTRHKVNNALQGVELQRERNLRMDERFAQLERSDTGQWEHINHLRENAVSQVAVDRYRKWIFGTVLMVGGLGIINLLINFAQAHP